MCTQHNSAQYCTYNYLEYTLIVALFIVIVLPRDIDEAFLHPGWKLVMDKDICALT